MKFRKHKQEAKPPSEYRLDREQIQFLGFALLISSSEARDWKSRIRFKEAHASILSQAANQIVDNYPSHDPDRNTTKIALDETKRSSVGEALKFIVELEQECDPDSKLTFRLGNMGINPSSAEIASQSEKVTDNAGETARNLQKYLGFVDPR